MKNKLGKEPGHGKPPAPAIRGSARQEWPPGPLLPYRAGQLESDEGWVYTPNVLFVVVLAFNKTADTRVFRLEQVLV